jgi:hypothetical protein
MKCFMTIAMTAVLCSVPVASIAQSSRIQGNFVGTDGNWFNPVNWSTGAVPDDNTDVFITGRAHVVIDPAAGPPEVTVRNLTLTGRATLETKPGSTFHARLELIENGSQLIHRATDAGCGTECGDLIVTWNAGLLLNPTPKTKRDIIMQSTATLTVGLGGTAPATEAALGAGTYATLTGESVKVGGKLKVEFLYGFMPSPGDSFTIIRSTSPIAGSYRRLTEGSMVARIGDVGLYLTYGRDETGQTREHVLLARQIGS